LEIEMAMAVEGRRLLSVEDSVLEGKKGPQKRMGWTVDEGREGRGG
jgi:hypothetical protein